MISITPDTRLKCEGRQMHCGENAPIFSSAMTWLRMVRTGKLTQRFFLHKTWVHERNLYLTNYFWVFDLYSEYIWHSSTWQTSWWTCETLCGAKSVTNNLFSATSFLSFTQDVAKRIFLLPKRNINHIFLEMDVRLE